MKQHLALVRSLVAGDKSAAQRILEDRSVNVPGFLAFARKHRLGTFCYWQIQRLELAFLLPPPLLAAAKAAALLERSVNERLLANLREITNLIAMTDADAVVIKGPVFAQRYSGGLEARSLADLDLLVRTQLDYTKVERILLEAGFERVSRVPLGTRLSRLFAHHFEYRRDGLPLDVHWALQRHFTYSVDYEHLWATTTMVDVTGCRVRAASDEYEIVLQVLGVLTDLQVGKLTLRSIVDIVHLLTAVNDTIDWPAFLAARAREHLLAPTAFVLHLALEMMGREGDFPELSSALQPTLLRLPPTSLAHDAILHSRALSLTQKLLALRVYETSLVAAVAWWAVSLPFRVSVYGITKS